MILEINPLDRKQRKEFINLPFRIYQDIPQWVPPLLGDVHLLLNPNRHPFYRKNKAAFFLAYRDGDPQPCARLALIDNRIYNEHNRATTAFFFLFECINEKSIATELFEAGFAWARKRGLTRIEGPHGFMAMDGFGLLVKGFEHRPAFGLPYNPDYYESLLLSAGFEPGQDSVSGYLSAKMAFPERIHRASEIVQKRRGLRILNFRTRSELRALIPKLKDLYNGALVGTEGGIPISDEEANAIGNQLLWFADPRLVKIILKDDEPVGFLLAYPDVSAALQRCNGRLWPTGWMDLLFEIRRTKWVNINGAGMMPEYRGLGGTAILFSEMQKSITEGHFEHADLVQIGVENDRMQRELADLGVDFYKTHRTYKRNL